MQSTSRDSCLNRILILTTTPGSIIRLSDQTHLWQFKWRCVNRVFINNPAGENVFENNIMTKRRRRSEQIHFHISSNAFFSSVFHPPQSVYTFSVSIYFCFENTQNNWQNIYKQERRNKIKRNWGLK